MFGSTILDVAIGVIFVFLAVSLISSTATEALASALKWRSATLLDGIKQLLNDKDGTDLARELYNHALINPRSDGKAASADDASPKPAYIDPAKFADALLDILEKRGPGPNGVTADPQLNELLSGMLTRAGVNATALKTEIATWFDRAMDRLSGAYKRRAQLCNFLIALAIAVLLNVDVLRVGGYLYEQPGITRQITAVNQTPADAAKHLGALGLPIGWVDQNGGMVRPHPWVAEAGWPPLGWILTLLGWLITATATLFGAPFWFDMLKGFVALRGTGPSPNDKPSPGTARQPANGPEAMLLSATRPSLLTAPLVPAAASGKAAAIIAVCEHEWPAAKSDCNLFVRNVATQFGVTLTGNADAIVDQIQGTGWDLIADGVAASTEAAAGKLVIAGLKGADQQQPSDHGHVVVVVAGPLAQDKYPSAYWGRLGGVGAKNKTINWAWRAVDRDNVIYSSRVV